LPPDGDDEQVPVPLSWCRSRRIAARSGDVYSTVKAELAVALRELLHLGGVAGAGVVKRMV